MQINESALAVASSETDIAAPPDVVWETLVDFAHWPSWNPDVKSVSVSGPAAEGGTFKWRAGPTTITSTLRHVERPSALAWTGKTLGIRAIHVWRLEGRERGTAVRTQESWEGWLVGLLRGRMRRMLQRSLDDGLPRLRAEAERRAAAG